MILNDLKLSGGKCSLYFQRNRYFYVCIHKAFNESEPNLPFVGVFFVLSSMNLGIFTVFANTGLIFETPIAFVTIWFINK